MENQLTNKQLALFFGCDAMVSMPNLPEEIRMKIDEKLLYEIYNLKGDEPKYSVKPILRPITDWKEMDIVELAKIFGQEDKLDAEENESVIQDIKKRGWDAFDADTKLKHCLEVVPLLISRQFDIFGWIEKNLAIDKTKVKQP